MSSPIYSRADLCATIAVIIRSPTEPNPAYITQRHDPALATYQPTSIVICTSINATCIRSDDRAYVALQWVGGVLLVLPRSGAQVGRSEHRLSVSQG